MKILVKDCQHKERTIYQRSFSLNDKGNHEILSHSCLIYIKEKRLCTMKQYVNLETIDMFKNKSIEIMPLTVLTGVNGSGKTTILKAIEDQFSNTKHYKWTGLSIFKEHFEGEKGDILLFEQPEVGLHPKFQLALADVILAYAQAGRTVVVETHSDHFINRVSRRMMENEYIRKNSVIYFFNKDSQGNSSYEIIEVDPIRGIITNNENFFMEFSSETEKIIMAGYKNKIR